MKKKYLKRRMPKLELVCTIRVEEEQDEGNVQIREKIYEQRNASILRL
jgi:hypothetical protein